MIRTLLAAAVVMMSVGAFAADQAAPVSQPTHKVKSAKKKKAKKEEKKDAAAAPAPEAKPADAAPAADKK
jgi:hypothetical protein